VAPNCVTAQFATITQQTSAAASQAESDAQSAIDQAKRELEDLQRNQEREEDQARTLTDMSFDQRTELDQKISSVTDRNSGLNALDAIQSSGIITADEALEVRRANSEITQEILRKSSKTKKQPKKNSRNTSNSVKPWNSRWLKSRKRLKAITGLNQQILQQGRQYLTEIENFRRALSQP
jgi:hypothetical protein